MVSVMRIESTHKFAGAATRGSRDWCVASYQPINPEEAPAR